MHGTIMRASHLDIQEFVANIPNIGDKLEKSIENLMFESTHSTTKNSNHVKEKLEPNPTTYLYPKKAKPLTSENIKSPSTKEGQKKRILATVTLNSVIECGFNVASRN